MPRKPDRSRGRVLTVSVVLGLGAAALVSWRVMASGPPAEQTDAGSASPWAAAPSLAGSAADRGAGATMVALPAAPSRDAAATPFAAGSAPFDLPPTSAGGGQGAGVFRTEADGRLQVDQAMRERMEALLALHGDDPARMAAELAALPPAAAAKARELMAQFASYQQAQRAAFPPGDAPLVPEEGLAQLSALQAMRASHFGADEARRMYAQDDAVSRRLLELMAEDHSTTRSMAEKAMRAQARFDSERGGVKP